MIVGSHNCLLECNPSDIHIDTKGNITVKGTMIEGSGPIINGNKLNGMIMTCTTSMNNAMVIELDL